MQKYKELKNIYCFEVSILAKTMTKWGMYLNAVGQHSLAASTLHEVYTSVLPYTRIDPRISANVAAQLGLVLNKLKNPCDMDTLMDPEQSKPDFWHQLGVDIALNEIPHDWELIQSIFVQQAAIEIERADACKACALLLKAHEVCVHITCKSHHCSLKTKHCHFCNLLSRTSAAHQLIIQYFTYHHNMGLNAKYPVDLDSNFLVRLQRCRVLC